MLCVCVHVHVCVRTGGVCACVLCVCARARQSLQTKKHGRACACESVRVRECKSVSARLGVRACLHHLQEPRYGLLLHACTVGNKLGESCVNLCA